MTCKQGKEKCYHSSNVHEGFISAVSLLNNLMKYLVFNCVIF